MTSCKTSWGGAALERLKRALDWKTDVQPALSCKVSEFHSLGYHQVTEEDIWNCLVQKVWKGNPSKHLYEIVQDIFHLGTAEYMSYLASTAHQDDDLMASIAALTKDEE